MKLEKAYQIIGMTEEEFRYLDTTQILESPDSPTGYVVSFRYKSSEYKKLSVIGDWMFSDKEHSSFTDSGRYWPHQWKKEYFPHTLLGLKTTPKELKNGTKGEEIDVSKFEFDLEVLKLGMYEMEKDDETDIFSCTIPLPSGTYNYRFVIDMPDGNPLKTVTMTDPSRKGYAYKNEKIQYSQIRVPFCAKYQVDDRTVELGCDAVDRGKVRYIEYAVKKKFGVGETQPAAVYLPKGYDENREKPYPVLYLSHGGSESLSTWLNQGSVSQIMDFLIVNKKIQPTVVVMMDNSIYQWNHKEKNIPSLIECLLPYMEKHYHVASEPEGRAFAGLSAGGFLAFDIFESVGYLFGNIGIWSGGRRFEADYTKPYLKNVRVHIGAGTFDDAYRAFAQPLEQELLENGIPYTMDIIPGGHQWSVWRKLLEKFLSR